MMTGRDVHVRPALPDDEAADLLYLSAAPYYDAYTGSRERAVTMIERLFARPGHACSFDVCSVAETFSNEIVGVMSCFTVEDSDRLARNFVARSMLALPLSRLPGALRHLRASSRVSPQPPPHALYVDALAVAPAFQRQGIAGALVAEAIRQAEHGGLRVVALDTGLENRAAQSLYERLGFTRTGEQRAADERTARAVGGPGFVSYELRLRKPVE